MALECESVVSSAKTALDFYEVGAEPEAMRALDRARDAAENLSKYPKHKRRVRNALEVLGRVQDFIAGTQDPSASNYYEYLEETPEEQAERRLGLARRAIQRATA